MPTDIKKLVADDATWVSREAFLDKDIYAREQEQIFRHCWLFLGHESQIRHPGDFITTYMGEDPVIVTRDRDGDVHAMLNSCRHRGMRVCRADKGNTRHFVCPYHAWTYDSKGQLVGVRLQKTAYYGELDRSQLALPKIRVETYKGLIFGNLDSDAESLIDYLGDMAWYLDVVVDRREGGAELIGGVHKWIIRTNWKIPAENHAGDWYHVPVTHGSMAHLYGGGLSASEFFAEDDKLMQASPEIGHGLALRLDDTSDGDPMVPPKVATYRKSIAREMEERLGPVRSRIGFIAGTVFPNFGWIPEDYSIRVFHPRGPQAVEIWSYCIVDAAAPPEVKNYLRKLYIRRFGPSGMLEQDDGENWSQVTSSSRGQLAREFPFDYAMGSGHERAHPELRGRIANGASELVHRSIYTRWRSEMLAERQNVA